MTDITKFDPLEVAGIETEIWKAYYNRRFVKLAVLMVSAMRELYGLSRWNALWAAYHFAWAAIDFRLNRYQEDGRRITDRLTKGMAIVCLHTDWRFDHVEAAKREYHWWLIDRYPEQYRASRPVAIAKTAAIIYGTDDIRLTRYALRRASAMLLHDKVEAGDEPENWSRIESLLTGSYQALSLALE